MDVRDYNRAAWDAAVAAGNRWTLPVDSGVIARAREGSFSIVLTPNKPVPRSWFGNLAEKSVLCLASGGGQQAPILAAAGATVTVLDNSPRQLERDREVAAREGLTIETVEGDMRKLPFEDASFDLIVHPCSNSFVPEIRPVWREAHRVLGTGGEIISGFCLPLIFLFDPDLEEKGELRFKYAAPYSDLTTLTDDERRRYTDKNEPLSFGHTLEDQIGGQTDAGLAVIGFYDDVGQPEHPLTRFTAGYAATRAKKLG